MEIQEQIEVWKSVRKYYQNRLKEIKRFGSFEEAHNHCIINWIALGVCNYFIRCVIPLGCFQKHLMTGVKYRIYWTTPPFECDTKHEIIKSLEFRINKMYRIIKKLEKQLNKKQL